MKIFGYTFEEIEKMQQKQFVNKTIGLQKPAKAEPTEKDFALLREFGEIGLREKEMYGVLDRLNLL